MNKLAYCHLCKLAKHTKRADIGHSVRFRVGGGLLGLMVGNYLSKPKYKLLGTGVGGLLGAGAGVWLGSLGDMTTAQQAQYSHEFEQRMREDIERREREQLERAGQIAKERREAREKRSKKINVNGKSFSK